MRLLMVEDDVRLASLLRRGLADEGFTVDWAADGLEGLRRALAGSYNVIMLDVMLPGLHGYGVCARLREAGSTTPILMLTAKDGEYDEAEGLETGADDYLIKPFSFMVLTARLKALIRRSSGPGTTAWTVGDLRIEPVALRCWRAGQEITLTAKEFAVLACLAERAGQVVTKTDIVRRVWDEHYDGDLNIPSHLARLLANLVENARRHTTTTVQVRITTDDREVILEVIDDGPGIPAKDRERVFDRFTRLDDARTRQYGGTGLGLAIARSVATTHGGALTAEAPIEPHGGARLVLRLPKAFPG